MASHKMAVLHYPPSPVGERGSLALLRAFAFVYRAQFVIAPFLLCPESVFYGLPQMPSAEAVLCRAHW